MEEALPALAKSLLKYWTNCLELNCFHLHVCHCNRYQKKSMMISDGHIIDF